MYFTEFCPGVGAARIGPATTPVDWTEASELLLARTTPARVGKGVAAAAGLASAEAGLKAATTVAAEMVKAASKVGAVRRHSAHPPVLTRRNSPDRQGCRQ